MKTPLTTNKSADFQSFYDKWVEEFRIQENNQSQLTVYNLDRLWEGTAAFVALTKAGALHNVMPTKEFEYDENLPKYTLRGLYKEVEIYRLYRNRISDVNNKFKDAMEDILQASDRISRMP